MVTQTAGNKRLATHILYKVAILFNVNEISRWLAKMDTELMAVAMVPPDKPLVHDNTRNATEKAYKVASKFYVRIQEMILPPSYFRIFMGLSVSIYSLRQTIYYLSFICDRVREAEQAGVSLYPNPCHTHTLDFNVEWVTRDFKKFIERADPAVRQVLHGFVGFGTPMRHVEEGSKGFLERLQILSSYCVHFAGANCLKYADPEKTTPAPLRAHILDLSSATRTIHKKFIESYQGVREWRVGSIRLYEHPKTTEELLDLAEYTANVLHKMIEMKILPLPYADSAGVFSLKDRVEIMLKHDMGGMVVKPRWVVDVYSFPIIEDMVGVLRHILTERGFKTEPITHVFGFKVTMPPGDVREALRIACMLPVMPTKIAGKAYELTLSMIESLESKLKEQKPLKRCKSRL
jgi:hypothetical protein